MGSSDCISNISRQFLAEALGSEWEIDSYKVTSGTKPGDNFMSLIYNAEVNAKDKKGTSVTRHLLIKCYPNHPGRQEFVNKSNMFFKEMEVYRLWMPELRKFQTEVIGLEKAIKLPYAPFVHGKCIDFESAKENEYAGKVFDSLDNYIIMEDIRATWGFRMANRRECLDMDHMRLVILELAKVHAMSWAYKAHVEKDVCSKFPCLVSNFSPEDQEMWSNLSIANIDQAILTLDEILGVGNNLSKAMEGFKVTIVSVFDVFLDFKNESELDSLLRVKHDERFGKDSPNPEPWRVICHGDCWSNNLLFRYDERTEKPVEVVLVDLQMCRESCVMPDLVYVIYVCMDAATRKNHLNALLELYFLTFNDFCRTLKVKTLPGFTMEAFKYRFHRYKLLGLVMAVIGFPIMLKEEDQAQALNLEDMDHSKDIAEIFSEVCQTSGTNTIYKERLLGVVQELFDEGVI